MSVPDASQSATNEMNRSSAVKMDPFPSQRAIAMLGLLPNADIDESFSLTVLHALSAIIVDRSDPGLVSKEHSAPLLPGPAMKTSALLKASLVEYLCQWLVLRGRWLQMVWHILTGRWQVLPYAGLFFRDGSVAQSCQLSEVVVVVSRPRVLFSTACHLKSFQHSLNDRMGHRDTSLSDMQSLSH